MTDEKPVEWTSISQYENVEGLPKSGRYIGTLVAAEEFHEGKQAGTVIFYFDFVDESGQKLIGKRVIETRETCALYRQLLDALGVSHGLFKIIKLSSILGCRAMIDVSLQSTADKKAHYYKIERFSPVPKKVE